MSEFSQELIGRSGYLNEGFAEVYDRFRPAPSAEVLRVLTTVAQVDVPDLVVDVGSGTGLATRTWATHAANVVGVEPNPRMVERARAATPQANVHYVQAYASETGLSDGAADLVTTFQAFHWMEPEPVLAETARILRTGGVFAAVDYDVPPFVEPEVTAVFDEHFAARREARDRLGNPAGGARWRKEGHLERIRDSGCFRYAREIVAHSWWELDAKGVIGLAESLGGPRAIFGDQAPEVAETFERLREAAQRVVGDRPRPVLLCWRMRIGVK